MNTALNAARRARELDALADETVDVLIIGGGVTGAGAALDAAARGLSVALVERRDLAWGSSRWSSKLAHGGLRYLAKLDFGVAWESARERHILMTRTAPHLVRALPQVLPLNHAVDRRQGAITGVGFGLGDLLRRAAGTPSRALPRPRFARADAAAALAPGISRDGLRGAWVSHDGQLVDDARLVVALARTAAGLGARILTRVAASNVRADGAELTDELSGSALTVRARSVINATGVWSGDVDASVRLRPSRGTHVVLRADRLGSPRAALLAPLPGSTSRFVFALPAQLGRVILGLTDEEAPRPVPDVPLPVNAEIDFLLGTFSRVLERPITRDDVAGSFAGLRPLVDTGGGSSADFSRKHLVEVSQATGAVNVLGGKLTTYRAMAEDAVSLAVGRFGLRAGPCRTENLPLVGSGAADLGLPPAVVARHGSDATAVLASGADLLAEELPHIDIARGEIAWAVTHEGALDADDVLDRRTRIGLVRDDREAVKGRVAALVDEARAGT